MLNHAPDLSARATDDTVVLDEAAVIRAERELLARVLPRAAAVKAQLARVGRFDDAAAIGYLMQRAQREGA